MGAARFRNKNGTERYVAFGEPGYPDYSIILFHQKLPLAGYIEVKTATGRQSPEQKRFQQWCEQHSICYILARSVEDVDEQIRAYLAFLTDLKKEGIKDGE